MAKGDVVTLLEDDGWGWSRVRLGTVAGWVQNVYLSGKNHSQYRTGVCNGTAVNVRKTPSLSGEILQQIGRGKTFTIISILPTGWMHINVGKLTGYLYYDPSYLTIP